jgi:K+-sensing histidine kinase KdpD
MADNLPPPASTTAPPVPIPWERVERFVGQLTHDVRNGLNALELQLTYLGEICADPEAAQEVKHLRRSLLDVTRQLQAVKTLTGPVTPHPMDYPATELFEDLRERFERQHPEGVDKVRWEIYMGAASLEVDPELSMTALLELLANALHFGADAGNPAVFSACVNRTGSAAVTLRESKPADAPPIGTERWGQEAFQSTRRNAYGLGLFRARRIIEAQRGTLSAAYCSTQHILTTDVTLPLSSSAAG